MLTSEDIKNLIEAQKEVFVTKGDLQELKDEIKDFRKDVGEQFSNTEVRFQSVERRFDEMRQDFLNLQISVDAYAKKADTYFQEMAALGYRVNRHEKWLQQIAEKIGMKLEY